MENGQLLRNRSQALDRELAGVLLKISDTAERAARNLIMLRMKRNGKGVNFNERGNVGQKYPVNWKPVESPVEACGSAAGKRGNPAPEPQKKEPGPDKLTLEERCGRWRRIRPVRGFTDEVRRLIQKVWGRQVVQYGSGKV